MALTKTDQDRAVIVLLKKGLSAVDTKAHCERTLGLEDFALSRIYALNRELKEEPDIIQTVEDLSELPVATVEHIVNEAKHGVMVGDSQTKGAALAALDKTLTAKKGLEKLSLSFQHTMSEALLVVDKHLRDPELPLKDVKMMIDTISKAHSEIFNSTTNIHIGDNNTDNKKLSVFQNTMRN